MSQSRRQFLKSTTATTLVVGIPLPLFATATAPGVDQGKSRDDQPLNAYLSISTDSLITATLPTSEMGQGTHSGQVMILSQELGVDPSTIHIDMPVRPTDEYRFFSDRCEVWVLMAFDFGMTP